MDIDDATITRMVGIAVDDPSVEVGDWSAKPLGGGMTNVLGTTAGVSRIAGAGVANGRRIRWSIVVKVLRRAVEHDDPADWDFWKREAFAYRAGLLTDLPDGFAAPRCLGVEELADDRIALWLEDVPDIGPTPWPLARYGLAARHLGRFNGAYLTGRALPHDVWLSSGRVRQWLAQGEPGLADLPRIARTPIGAAWLPDELVARTQRQWRDCRSLLDGLDRLPRCLCHHDAFRRNLIASRAADGRERTVAIDWAGIGLGAIGEDLASMVSISLQFLEVDVADAAMLDRITFDGYVAGLRDVGLSIDEREVRFGYAAAANLLLGIGGTGGWLPWLLEDDDRPRLAEQIIGSPINETLAQWRGLQAYLLDLGDEAHRLINELDWPG